MKVNNANTTMSDHANNLMKQELSLKKTKGVGLKKEKKVLVHKSYTDDGKLQGSMDSYFGELC